MNDILQTTALRQMTAPLPPQLNLLGLPPELRKLIYELLVVRPRAISVRVTRGKAQPRNRSRDGEPRFFLTCGQIRAEARPFFYHLNDFSLSTPLGGLPIALQWINDETQLSKIPFKALVFRIKGPMCYSFRKLLPFVRWMRVKNFRRSDFDNNMVLFDVLCTDAYIRDAIDSTLELGDGAVMGDDYSHREVGREMDSIVATMKNAAPNQELHHGRFTICFRHVRALSRS